MNFKKVKTGIVVSALAGCLAVGGVSAFFTDTDRETNTFTVGKIAIDLLEPGWTPVVNMTPEEEMKKDPQVKNIGINDAYVFVEVKVPYAKVTTANENGTKNPKADTELFQYDVKNGWLELGTGTKNAEEGTVTHLYAYGTNESMTAVKANVTTTPVFDYIKFANVVEDEGLEGKELNVVVDAYAIQTSNINDGKTGLDGNNRDGKVKPSEVWAVLNAQ